MKKNNLFLILLFVLPIWSMAQDKEATLTMSFDGKDSIKHVVVTVMDADKPAAKVDLKLFADRLGGQLPIGEATTDDNGIASFDFPADLPGDLDRNIHVICKLEENDIYMDNETDGTIKWGKEGIIRPSNTLDRSLSAGRARAPIYFIVASVTILVAIWGTLCYIVLQIFGLRKLGSVSEDNHL